MSATKNYKPMSPSPYPFASKLVATEAEIRDRVEAMAAQIAADFKSGKKSGGKDDGVGTKENPLVLIAILKGSYIFTSDLARALFRHGIFSVIEFVATKSYIGAKSSGKVKLTIDVKESVAGKHILFIEDILDTAYTLTFITQLFAERKAASVSIAVMLDKPEGRVVPLEADYVGFTIANEFVIGYGLDFGGMYREMPDIAVLRPEEYMSPEALATANAAKPAKSKL